MALWVAYFGIALLDVATDGAMCYLAQKRFKLRKSILASLFWPITMPIMIAGAWVGTRKCPEWKK